MKQILGLIILFSWVLPANAQDGSTTAEKTDKSEATELVKESIGIRKIKHNDQVLPRFFIDVNYKLGRISQKVETIDLAAQYENTITSNTRFGETKFTDGISHGGDIQIGLFVGKGRRFGIGTGVSYFIQTADLTMNDLLHVEYQSSDNKSRIFRQHITSTVPIVEEWKFTSINIPLMLKLKHQFRNSKVGFMLDAGGFLNISNKNKYSTNATFDYEAIYKLSNDGSLAGFDNGVKPSANSWLITKDFYNSTTPQPANSIEDFFNNKQGEGYNVGLNQAASAANKSGTATYNDLSYGAIAQLSLSYYLSYNVTFNLGGYYMYQLWNNDGKQNYRITDKIGDYSSLMNSIKTTTASSYGMTVGFRFFFGEKRDLDWDNIPDKLDKCMERYGLLVNGGCPDTDNDGIIDDEDDCIDVPGTQSANGCPDRDGDGITDGKDKCPDVPGEYQGCPEDMIAKKYIEEHAPVKQAEPKKIHYDVLTTDILYFEFGKSVIEDESYTALDKAAEVLSKQNDVILFISGYTDAIGTYAANMKLSFERAEMVSNYIQSKGISKDRIIISGYGKDNPKSSNETAEERAKNRRIEMKLLLPVEEE